MKALALLALLTIGCTDESGSRRALENQGFSDIQLTGYAWWGCGDSDSFRTNFTAKNPTGRQVSGVVCCGMMKSCTIRW